MRAYLAKHSCSPGFWSKLAIDLRTGCCDEANGRMTVDTEKSGSWEEPGETRDEVWTVLGT